MGKYPKEQIICFSVVATQKSLFRHKSILFFLNWVIVKTQNGSSFRQQKVSLGIYSH